MSADHPEKLLRYRFGQVHRVYDFGENAQAWIADPGLAGARSLREVAMALRPRLYVAELTFAGGKWCIEFSAWDPQTGQPLPEKRAGVTPFESKPRARKVLRAWALLLAGRFDGHGEPGVDS